MPSKENTEAVVPTKPATVATTLRSAGLASVVCRQITAVEEDQDAVLHVPSAICADIVASGDVKLSPLTVRLSEIE